MDKLEHNNRRTRERKREEVTQDHIPYRLFFKVARGPNLDHFLKNGDFRRPGSFDVPN